MAFQARMYTDSETATVSIRLVGELDSGSAGRLNELIAAASRHPVRRLVLLMERLALPFLGRSALPGLRATRSSVPAPTSCWSAPGRRWPTRSG